MIAFYLPGNVPIYSFSIIIGIASVVGFGWTAFHVVETIRSQMIKAGIFGLFGALMIGRASYVLFNWSYFQNNNLQIFQINAGGLTWCGALFGGAISIFIYAKLTRAAVNNIFDNLLPMICLISVASWMGCYIEGCAYGDHLDTWWAIPTRDEFSVVSDRFPLQIIAATLLVIWYVIVGLLSRNKSIGHLIDNPGPKSFLWFSGFGLIMLLSSLMRADFSPIWFGWKSDTWLSLIIFVISVLILLSRILDDRQMNKVEMPNSTEV